MKLLVAGFFLLAGNLVHAQNVHGVLRVVKGDVQIKSSKDGQTSKARIGAQVFPKDVVITGKDSRAKIVMVDNNEINVSPESQIEIQHYEYDPGKDKKDVLLNVIYGKVRSKVEQHYDGEKNKFQVQTPSAVAGVRGTDFMVSYQGSNTQVVTFRGAVAFGTPGANGQINNAVSVTPGHMATSVAGAPPTAPVSVPKGQFAKMDQDSNAEGPGSGRTPSNSNDNGNDKDKGKHDGQGQSGPNSSNSRGPSSVGGGSMITSADMAGGDTNGPSVPLPLVPPPPPPPLPQSGPCIQCIIQNTNTNLRIHLTN